MKIATRLLLQSVFSAAGLACVAAVSYLAVTSIRDDLHSLTSRATPMQTKTFELQERTERVLGRLLKLSMTRDKAEADKVRSSVESDLQAITALRQNLQELDPKTQREALGFAQSLADISQAVDKGIADTSAYRAETERARADLQSAEAAVSATRIAVKQIGTDAGKAADQAQDASRRLAQLTKQVMTAQSRLKEMVTVVAEADHVSNRFRLTPLKEKLKSSVDGISRLTAEAGGTDALGETRALASRASEAMVKDGTGLFSLRADVLANKPDAAEAYARQRKAVIEPIEAQYNKLNAIVDNAEVQAVKQHQTLEAALRLRNEPGGVVVTSEEVSLAIRDVVGSLRLLMLSATQAEADAAKADLQGRIQQLSQNLTGMQSGLQKMGKPPLAAQVGVAITAIASVNASIQKVAATKLSLLDSNAAMAATMERLKTTAQRQAAIGDTQVRDMASRQAEVSAAVDKRVQSSLLVIMGIALAIIAVSGVTSWLIVRAVTGRLNEAVRVAEEVSCGRLIEVQVPAGNDETTRLMSALARMVNTLKGMVGNIRMASDQIREGSREIQRGNADLSERTEQQASQLQQTSASVTQLTAMVTRNADSARHATALAAEAADTAGRGGAVVENVVNTMTDIQHSSREIGEIVGVIDGIAFQTNILALNAAVEAARAGEHGRGFAVVASEVRGLALKSAEAAQQVKAIVDASVSKISQGSDQAQAAGSTMHGMVEQVATVNRLIAEIARASNEQAAAIGSVGTAVGQLDELTQRNAALSEQGSAAAASLDQQAQSLQDIIAEFKTAH